MSLVPKALLMVEPTTFGFNTETAASNFFQIQDFQISAREINERAKTEFSNSVSILKQAEIQVYVERHKPELDLPDAVFPNNWISFMPDGTVIIYPMLTPNRRKEKNMSIIEKIETRVGYKKSRTIDLTFFENEEKYLEGTGSIVFDHISKTAFACISPRTHHRVLEYLCGKINYNPILFNAFDSSGKNIYHTNVMMTITKCSVLICFDSISDILQKETILKHFLKSGRLVIDLSQEQMNAFAGNMLEVENSFKESCLIMSESANKVLHSKQIASLKNLHKLVILPIPTIEKTGGGSARCMLAEIFI